MLAIARETLDHARVADKHVSNVRVAHSVQFQQFLPLFSREG